MKNLCKVCRAELQFNDIALCGRCGHYNDDAIQGNCPCNFCETLRFMKFLSYGLTIPFLFGVFLYRALRNYLFPIPK